MAWTNFILCFYILIYLWICCQASSVVNVNCWWNQSLPIADNVSIVCHTSSQGIPLNCDFCQLDVMTPVQRHQLPNTCANIFNPFVISVASEHRGHIRCMLKCRDNKEHTCNVTVLGGNPPSPPSRPDCVIEHMDMDMDMDIHCSWSTAYKPVMPTTYTLYWEDHMGEIWSKVSENEHCVIKRSEYEKCNEMTVWVTARNVLGTAESQQFKFNTHSIIRPATPDITNHTSSPLEIFWEMSCDIPGFSGKKCEVQYHTVDDVNWTKVDDYQVSFWLEDPQPFTEYQFRVRCRCEHEEHEENEEHQELEHKVISNWTSVYSVRTPPAAPVGKLDVWSDCPPNFEKSICNVFWKEMPVYQARGEINNYIVTFKLENGTEIKQVTRQRRDTKSQQSGDEGCQRLRHFSLLPGVKDVFVSANTSISTSDPTLLALPVQGLSTPGVNLSVTEMNQKLVVSWSVPSWLSKNIQEYVVQHVSVEPSHTSCLNWTRVNKTQSSVTFTGEFRNYTAYNVSLFAVIDNSSNFLRSTLAYTLQGVPPKVPEFHVKNISHTSVTLIWSHIPVHESKGVILQYTVGVNEATGVNVSSDRTSYQISELQPAQQYQAWVSAVTVAGEGARSITTFSTEDKPGYVTPTLLAIFIIIPLFVLTLLIVLIFMLRSSISMLCFEVIPDPTNSKSFKHANFQHVWPGICSTSGSVLKISELEIVENLISVTAIPPSETILDTEFTQDHKPDGDREIIEDNVEPARETVSGRDGWRKDYSEMVDTDEEEGGGGGDEDDDEEWEEQNCVSDYERHFMPSVEAI
nr:interleukin 12 receptor, beta 2a, like [Misgurnus anguillicaudatus]